MIDQPTDHSTDTSNSRRTMLAGIGGLAAGAFLASTANAGPLAPPSAPISSTPGPEPRIAINAQNTPGSDTATFRITQPGSYYLAGNIVGEEGKNGIEIFASGVTLDLMGFDMAGVPGTLDGIQAGVGHGNITIRNGSIRNWGSDGIRLNSSQNHGWRVECVNTSDNGNSGIILGPTGAIIDCLSSDNGVVGIAVGNSCTVMNCCSQGNTSNGIVTGTGCTVMNCSSNDNAVSGFAVGSGSTVSNCSAKGNSAFGVTASFSSIVLNCIASGNSGSGIALNGESLLMHCNCDRNGAGGVGAGIRATGSDNRIEGCNSSDNQIGIQCTALGNFIARNTCSGNAQNWSIAAGNKCLVINGVDSAAISGNSGGVSPGSTDPNANYTY